MSRFFIDRPVFATVVSAVIVLAGLVAYSTLPVAQYPEVAPPTVQVTALYPGAHAQTLRDTVADLRGRARTSCRASRYGPGRHTVADDGWVGREGAVGLRGRRDAASRAARGDFHRSCPCRSSQAWLGTKRRRAGVRCGERLGAGARWSRCGDRRRLGVRADRPDGTPAWCPLGRRPFGRGGRTHPSTLICCRAGPRASWGTQKAPNFLTKWVLCVCSRRELTRS